jgi:hypothetical protein
MAEEINPLAGDGLRTASSRRHAKRQRNPRRSRRGNSRRGRQLLILIFCVLAVMNSLLYFAVPPEADGTWLPAAIIGASLWYTFLLIGIWRRRAWCRQAMICVQGAVVAALMIVVPSSNQILDNSRSLVVFLASMAVSSAMAWILARSPDIQRLTSRSYE